MENNKPHCWAKMTWILDYPIGKERNVCSRCEHGVKECLKLTRQKADTLKTEIDNLKVNGNLDVFDPGLSALFRT